VPFGWKDFPVLEDTGFQPAAHLAVMVGMLLILASKASWLIRSKHFSISVPARIRFESDGENGFDSVLGQRPGLNRSYSVQSGLPLGSRASLTGLVQPGRAGWVFQVVFVRLDYWLRM